MRFFRLSGSREKDSCEDSHETVREYVRIPTFDCMIGLGVGRGRSWSETISNPFSETDVCGSCVRIKIIE